MALISTLSIPVANAGKPTVSQECLYNDYGYDYVKVFANPGKIPGGTSSVEYTVTFYKLENSEYIDIFGQTIVKTKRPDGLILDGFTSAAINTYNISKVVVLVAFKSSNGTNKGGLTLDNCSRSSW
jgi:hypothetical protein